MKRQEFPPSVIFEILKRATNARNRLICEGCGQDVTGKKADVDHTLPDALVMEKRTLTAADGKLLGRDCCHKDKTARDIKVIRKADRQKKFHSGLKKRRSTFACSRGSRLKRKVSGEVVLR